MIRGLLRIVLIVVLGVVLLRLVWRLLGLAVMLAVVGAAVAVLVLVLKRLVWRGRSGSTADCPDVPFVRRSRSKLARIERRIEKLETILFDRS